METHTRDRNERGRTVFAEESHVVTPHSIELERTCENAVARGITKTISMMNDGMKKKSTTR